ncbi:MAG: polysaccharide biosynthesis tyrosine autokinase [Chthoniobacter sp.]|nr:polysaccharide biosynthesis tyrosine autokinase [Chthoniobacter sp.]
MSTRRNTKSAQLMSDETKAIDLQAWLFAVREKWWIIALCLLATLGLAGAYLVIKKPVYTAQAIVQVAEDDAKVINIQSVDSENYKSDIALKSVEGAFSSNSLLVRVARLNDLEKVESAFKPAPGGPPKTDAELADIMQRKSEAKLKRGSRSIEINFDSTDPERAAKVARSMIDEYVKTYFEQNNRMTLMANDFLRKQAAELKDRLGKSEQALQAYREEHGTVSLDEKQNVTTDYLKQLNLKLEEARSNRIKIESDLPTLRKAQTAPVEELLAVQSISALLDVQDALKLITAKESEFSQIKKRYLELHPKYIQTNNELRSLRETLDRAARKGASIVLNSYQGAKETEEKLKVALQEQQKGGVELSRIAIGYDELRRQVDSDKLLYESVLARAKETKLSEGLEKSNIRVVQEPLPPKDPSKPKIPLILGLAFVAGIGGALALIILQQAFDSTIRSLDQAESVLELPALTTVPEVESKKLRKTEGSPLMLVDEPSSRQAEAFRSLRTAISLLPDGAPTVILFTSAIPAEGKSFCAANYATSLAQQQLRTLIIDADLRKPGLGKSFSTPAQASGLSDVLSGKATFEEACHGTRVSGLSFMPAGNRNASPLELLADERFAKLLHVAREKFDRIILDTAPINAVSDTLLIVKHADATAFVVRARKTSSRTLLRALQLLDGVGAAPAGFILNRLPARLANYYYYDVGNYSSAGVYGT